MRTVFHSRHVIGYADGDHVLIDDADVVWDDDRIVFVGNGYDGEADTRVDFGDAVIGPGFVDLNALADIDHAIFDSYQDDDLLLGQEWSLAYFRNRRREVFGPEDLAFRREYALVQLLSNGVTTALPIAAESYRAWAETYEEFAALAEIVDRLGIRMYAGPSYRFGATCVDGDGRVSVQRDHAEGMAGFTGALAFAKDFDGAYDGRFRAMLAPSRLEHQTRESLIRTKQAGDDLGYPVRLHAAQSLEEVAFVRREFGARPIEVLSELGFLGERTLIPHAWAVDGHTALGGGSSSSVDLDRLADSGTTVVYCPLASARYAMVMESFDRYRERGVNIGLGTDTFPPDMLRVMDHASTLSKVTDRDSTAGQIADLYRAATLGGARALGRDDLGKLAPGAKADLIVVDLSVVRTGPIADPIRTMVMNAGGESVATVVVDGRTVVADHQVVGVDAEEMRVGAQRMFDAYMASFTERDHRQRGPDELFPPTFRSVKRGNR